MRYSRLIKRSILHIFLMCSIYAGDFPDGVIGVANYDYFKERLPSGSKGIYQIYSLHDGEYLMKYLGSAKDIDSRLSCHCKNNILVPGDKVSAILFDAAARQKEILEYEKTLIKRYAPPLNKHAGAPGRPWLCEQNSKLGFFLKHNKAYLRPEGIVQIEKVLSGENAPLRSALLRIAALLK